MRSFVVCVVVAASVAACDTPMSASLAEVATFTQHQTQWANRTFHSYTFDYTQIKFGQTSDVHITVQADTVALVVDAVTGAPADPRIPWPTIDGLFAIAQEALQIQGETVRLQYNEQFGYPTIFSENSNPPNPGGGFSATVANLQPLQ
jgi:hypothetical protein